MKKSARLENWYVGDYDLIYGEVYGHPNFTDGTFIRTSRVVSLDKINNKAETLNTMYELGKPFEINKGEVSNEIRS